VYGLQFQPIPNSNIVIFQIKAHPKSKKRQVKQTGENSYEIWVAEPPDKGRANEAVLRALAGHFGVAFSRLRLVSGASSKIKRIQLL
jgi:uncharacterized protein YggU (UPF0235/DUF167 family)